MPLLLRVQVPRSLGFGAIAVCAAIACTDNTGPADLMCPEATVPFCAKADSIRASAGPAVTDGEARSLPVLGNAPAKAAIQSELTALTTALAAGNVTRARSAVDRARAAISSARQAAGFPGDAPDLDAIDLALIQIELALK